MIPLDDLRNVERAIVLKGGIVAGTLERRRNAVAFSYDETYRRTGRPPVATSLPTHTPELLTHTAGALPPFFAGLLPEGRRLSALRGAVKTSADDDFTLLLAVGGDAIGDVQVVPEGADPEGTDALVTVTDWSDVTFSDLLARSIGRGGSIDRVALPGVQDKVSARMINVPVARADRRYLLKFDPPEFPHLVANEAFFLEAARRSGLETGEAEVVFDAEGTPGLLVTRFDRPVGGEDPAVRLPQEDGCQVLRRYPADKYRVTTEEVIAGLAGACRAPIVAALDLITQCGFAYLTCNGDAHAKNFSILRRAGEWRPSPAYDLPSSHPYGDYTMALTINGKNRENIGRADFLALGEATGVRPRAIERALDGLVDSVERWIDDLESLPFDGRVVSKLRRAIEYRERRLRAV